MEKLKAELERKKALAEAIRQKVAEGGEIQDAAESETKFVRQRDRENLKQRELDEAQRQLDLQREERRKLQREEEARLAAARLHGNSSTRTTTSELSKVSQSSQHPNLRAKYEYILQCSVPDAKQRLRRFKEPATIFGETDSQRKERLLNLCVEKDLQGWTDTSENQEAKLSDVDGTLLGKKRAHTGDETRDESPHNSKKSRATAVLDTETTGITNEDEEDNDSSGEESGEEDNARSKRKKNKKERKSVPENGLYFDPSIQYHKIEGLSPEKVIYKFFRSIIKQWEADLNSRPDFEKSSGRGREDTKVQKKCKDYIRPLFKLCQYSQVPADILHRLGLMVKYCEEGNFVKANDEYMRTAIGNAAWPMGLTMVGIHERSGRERISTAKIAHIMNNEQERKYLTSVKQLMTYAQTKRPDVPPSMKVL